MPQPRRRRRTQIRHRLRHHRRRRQRAIHQRHGRRLAGEPIDILINNAAIFPDPGARSFNDVKPQDILDACRVNVVGPFLVTRALVPNLELADRKLAIQITSNLGSIDEGVREKRTGQLAYASSKAALNMLSVHMGNELASRGLASIALHPGWIKTDMGGEHAPLDLTPAVTTIIKTIDKLTTADNARYVRYDGKTIAW
ncbi:MAG: SDR family NAD(P)-dependent oxidoreductase [Phycisphaerales bacterium]